MIPYGENIKFGSKGIGFTDKHGNKLTLFAAFKKAFNRFYNWWLDFKIFIVNLSGHCPFWTIRKLVYLLAGVSIGSGSKIHIGARFFDPKNISIGKDTLVGDQVFLDGRAELKIGDHTDIASQVLIYNSEHDINDPQFKAVEQMVIIGDYCFIGPRAIILPGVKIGRGAIVAAGAVVTKDVGENEIVGGVPAKKISDRKLKEFNYRLGRSRLFQ